VRSAQASIHRHLPRLQQQEHVVMPTVRDFMSTELLVLAPDQDVLRAMQVLLDRSVSGAPVVDARGNLVGLLTQRDCLSVALEAGYYADVAGKVEDYMTREVETVSAGMTLIEIIEKFYRSSWRRFPVLDENQLVGQISRRDVLRAFLEIV
jgi:predicted transcriptional regulator